MEENVAQAPSIRRHVSRMQGVLALGQVGDATFESSYPLDVGVLADFSESLAKFGDEERHRALCALLHLLKSETAGDLVPQIVSILEADVFEGSPPAEQSLLIRLSTRVKCIRLRILNPPTRVYVSHHLVLGCLLVAR